ncbi:MAG: J domain-containing protein [Burkholderiales bacterium]|nr:J domain-containing protein [Bacteroidia bacterium]
MADYYSILGLLKNASDIEIKTAFRKLAKVYHPDKNPNDPNAKHLFEHILKAYNTLINPHSRTRYDNANFSEPVKKVQTKNSRQSGQKEWSVSEEDLKRRDYYKKHYHHVKSKTASTKEKTIAPYTDYKYVLFATPIAVGLLMLILSIFGSELKTELIPQKKSPPIEIKNSSIKLSNGDKPYSGYFGSAKIYDTSNSLQINNSSSFDAVIVVFDKKTNQYIQHSYLKDSYYVEFSNLPENGVYWKCMLGKNWNNTKFLNDNRVSGGFDSLVQYQSSSKAPTLFPQQNGDELNLLYVIDPHSKNKQYISSEEDFFKK